MGANDGTGLATGAENHGHRGGGPYDGAVPEGRKHFHEELETVQRDVVRLGALAAAAIERGTDAFLAGDLGASDAVAAADAELDDLMHSIEDRTYALLALQAPMAGDLRTLVTMLRACHELERIGDLVVNIVQATHRVVDCGLLPIQRGIIDRMRTQAVEQVRVAVGALADRDPTKGHLLSEMDDVMDELQKELFRSMFTTTTTSAGEDEGAVQRSVQLALVGRYYERIADHAVNTGERVDYMVRGPA
jgi:phosphate transport system protein